MRIEATAKEIRALLDLVEADRNADQPASKAPTREAMARRVPRQLLERYQLLIEFGRSPAIVPIERGACSGCHVRLPTALEQRARRSPAIHTCPSCRRMLYAQETLSPPMPVTRAEP